MALSKAMDDLLAGETARKAVRELVIATVATVTTLIAAIGLYLLVPKAQEAFQTRDAELRHERLFEPTNTGARIVYRAPAAATDKAQRVQKYKKDLELLSRRFERGQFNITLLPGLKDAPIMAAMERNARAFSYSLSSDADSATMEIRAGGAARETLHTYIKYLSERWVVQR